jgi:hypothetical protein
MEILDDRQGKKCWRAVSIPINLDNLENLENLNVWLYQCATDLSRLSSGAISSGSFRQCWLYKQLEQTA